MAIGLLALVVLLAFAVEATLGFGATVVVVALGALLLPLDELLPAFIPLNVALSAFLVARSPRAIDLRLLVAGVLPLMVLGLPAGMFLFRALGERELVAAFGLFVVVLSAAELVRAGRASPSVPLSTAARVALLLLAGIVHGAFATGGPMAVYVMGRQGLDKGAFRATLSALWLVLNAVLLAGYAFSGELGRESAERSAVLAVPLALGLVLGEVLHARVPAALFRRLVFSLLLLAGAVLGLRSYLL